MRIRSLTYFTEVPRDWGRECVRGIIEEGLSVLGTASDYLKGAGYGVWSLRLSLPKPPPRMLSYLTDVLTDVVDTSKYLVSVGGAYLSYVSGEEVAEAASQGLYVPLLGLIEDVGRYSLGASEVIHEVAEVDPVGAAKVAVLVSDKVLETPYYPLSTSSGRAGLGISYLYVDLVAEVVRGRLSVEVVKEELRRPLEILSSAGYRVVADYSLSPWMEESVAGLIELMGFNLKSVGVNYAVLKLNEVVKEVLTTEYASGFNEVMMPYAEDSRLKELGCVGELKVRDLLTYTVTCVAGPDMAVVPWGINELRNLILDAYAIWRVKGRPVGVRVVPTTASAGDLAELGIFGKVCVISYD